MLRRYGVDDDIIATDLEMARADNGANTIYSPHFQGYWQGSHHLSHRVMSNTLREYIRMDLDYIRARRIPEGASFNFIISLQLHAVDERRVQVLDDVFDEDVGSVLASELPSGFTIHRAALPHQASLKRLYNSVMRVTRRGVFALQGHEPQILL